LADFLVCLIICQYCWSSFIWWHPSYW